MFILVPTTIHRLSLAWVSFPGPQTWHISSQASRIFANLCWAETLPWLRCLNLAPKNYCTAASVSVPSLFNLSFQFFFLYFFSLFLLCHLLLHLLLPMVHYCHRVTWSSSFLLLLSTVRETHLLKRLRRTSTLLFFYPLRFYPRPLLMETHLIPCWKSLKSPVSTCVNPFKHMSCDCLVVYNNELRKVLPDSPPPDIPGHTKCCLVWGFCVLCLIRRKLIHLS